ncbi:MAG: hypothetical protein GXY77_11545 [Fibrobacter sp.]|nr:hypothetical protein [Fibrobacter sp.]
MKRMFLTISAIVLLVVTSSCVKRDIKSCEIDFQLTLVNNAANSVAVSFSRFEENNIVKIVYDKTKDTVHNNSSNDFNINYQFEKDGNCNIGSSIDKDVFGSFLTITSGTDSKEYIVVPFDTTGGIKEFCSDCIYEYTDTLIIGKHPVNPIF